MNKNYNTGKSNNKGKIIACIIAAVLALTLAMGLIFGLTRNRVELPTVNSNIELAGDGGAEFETASGSGISIVAAQIPREQFGEYGIMTIADSAYTITATLTPADAENKKVTYTAAWSNPSSSWATGKNVSDYVTITQETDGALKATLTCKQAFGEKIVVTCKSQANTSATATADLHYKQRTTGYSLKITGLGNTLNLATTGTKTAGFKANFNQTAGSTFAVTVNKSEVYTKENTDSVTKVVITPTSGFTSAITGAGLSASTVTAQTITLNSSSGTLAGFLDSTFGTGIYASSASNRNKLINALKGFTAVAYNIEIYNGSTKVADGLTLTIDSSVISGQKVVESLQLDHTEIVF